MRILFSLCTLALLASVPAAEELTALKAMKLLPKEQAKNLARVEGRDGTPLPERWHILVHDQSSENGLREYVVAGGEIVASRTLSQFAETLTPADVILDETVKTDSAQAAKLAHQYASANEATVASLNYQLKKDGPDAAPLWRVTCLDEGGKELGTLVVSGATGNVLSHDGFSVAPRTASGKKETRAEKRENRSPEDKREPKLPVEKKETRVAAQKKPPKPQPPVEPAIAVATPVAPAAEPVEDLPPEGGFVEERRPGLLRRAGGSLQKVITGRDTISR